MLNNGKQSKHYEGEAACVGCCPASALVFPRPGISRTEREPAFPMVLWLSASDTILKDAISLSILRKLELSRGTLSCWRTSETAFESLRRGTFHRFTLSSGILVGGFCVVLCCLFWLGACLSFEAPCLFSFQGTATGFVPQFGKLWPPQLSRRALQLLVPRYPWPSRGVGNHFPDHNSFSFYVLISFLTSFKRDSLIVTAVTSTALVQKKSWLTA